MNQRAIVREKDRCRIVVGYEAMLSTPTICWMIKEIVFAPFAREIQSFCPSWTSCGYGGVDLSGKLRREGELLWPCG